MAQFTLLWDNQKVLAGTLATSQIAGYRIKTTGGAFITTGFSPINPLATSATTTDTPSGLPDNKVIEFSVSCNCSAGGPSANDNGIQENINFSCLVPLLTHTSTGSTIQVDLVNTDITKVRFTLRKALDNTTVFSAVVVKGGISTVSATINTLTPITNYYWQAELYANVNNTEVISSNADQLGTPCSPYPFTTDNPPFCNATTAGTISSVQVL